MKIVFKLFKFFNLFGILLSFSLLVIEMFGIVFLRIEDL